MWKYSDLSTGAVLVLVKFLAQIILKARNEKHFNILKIYRCAVSITPWK